MKGLFFLKKASKNRYKTQKTKIRATT